MVGLNPVASIFDQVDIQTRSLQPLLNRPVLLWCPRLTPKMLRAATRMNARLTHFGFVKGAPRTEGLNMISWHDPFGFLNKRSMSWEESLQKLPTRIAKSKRDG